MRLNVDEALFGLPDPSSATLIGVKYILNNGLCLRDDYSRKVI